MSTAVTIPLSNALLSILVANAIEAEKDLPDYIVGVLNQKVYREKPVSPSGLDEMAEELYEIITDAKVACTLGQAWQEKWGNWKDLGPGERIQVGLRFKKLLARISAGNRLPPGESAIVLERIGETAQGQAIYGKAGWPGARYREASGE